MTTPACDQSLASVYGSDTLNQGNLAVARLDFHLVAVKLILSSLVFFTFDCVEYDNENEPSTMLNNDMKTMVYRQNQYIELIWRYLLYRYDHSYAVRCFSHLVLSLLALIEALVHATQMRHYNEIIDSIVKETEQITL